MDVVFNNHPWAKNIKGEVEQAGQMQQYLLLMWMVLMEYAVAGENRRIGIAGSRRQTQIKEGRREGEGTKGARRRKQRQV